MPLIGMGGMGMGMGMGMGSPLLSGLMTGGLGYLLGRSSGQQQDPQVVQVMPAPTPQQSQPSQAAPAPSSGADNDRLAQLKLLGELHSSGVLTDEEFTREKNRILAR